MEAYTLKKPESIKRRKRVGRGPGSGHGKTCCRGQDGQGSRSGYSRRPWFEGGQMPLFRRMPKRGFNNKRFGKKYTVINVEQLNRFEDGTVVTRQMLENEGLIKQVQDGLVVLGDGDIKRKLTVKAAKFSASASEKIEAAGGKAEVV